MDTDSKVCFATFGDSKRYANSVRIICEEAKQFGCFTDIFPFDETTLDSSFLEQHKEFIQTNKRGFGYWLWKPQLVKQCFSKMNENDILVYADSGCRLNKSGLSRLQEYINMARESLTGNVAFPLVYHNPSISHIEQKWTKMDCLHRFNPQHWTTPQLVGGIFVIRKCPFTEHLVDRWYTTASEYHLLDDSPSILPNHPSFSEHRHDQSIWSLLRKTYGCVIVETDETWFPDFHNHMDTPIHAIRRSG